MHFPTLITWAKFLVQAWIKEPNQRILMLTCFLSDMCLLFGTQAMFDHDKLAFAAIVLAIRAGYQDKAEYEKIMTDLLKANDETLKIPLLLSHLKHLTTIWLNLIVREEFVRFDAIYNKY